MWLWILLFGICTVIYILGYILLRTSGNGRPWWERLVHPSRGGLQEEYGGTGSKRRQTDDH